MENTVTMSTVIESITSLFTGAISWLTTVVTTVMNNPLLLAFVLVAFLGIGISIFKRLTR